ncbi:hypothetical protein KQH65_05535 [archaeon]|nr:hypothetical protein [archaeon]
MEIKTRDIVTVVLLVAALISSYFVGSATSVDTTIIRTFYEPQRYDSRDNLYQVASVPSTPEYVNYTFSSNVTLTVYIQTKAQYNNVDDLDDRPEEYLASYTGSEGFVSSQIEEPTKKHIVTAYSEEKFTMSESILEAGYSTEVKAPSYMVTLTQITVLFALGSVVYRILAEKREED